MTALPTIAVMLGVHRVVHGPAITHPAGWDTAQRRRVLERALALLETPVEEPTVWEVP